MTENEMVRKVFEKMADGTIKTADAAVIALENLRHAVAVSYFCNEDTAYAVQVWETDLGLAALVSKEAAAKMPGELGIFNRANAV